jgi:pimeloyl-ACP methyl ester carboxylesterase
MDLTRRMLLGGLLGTALDTAAAPAPCTQVSVHASDLKFPLLVWGEEPAPPVMLLHGFPQEPWSWGPVAGRLAAAGYQVIVPWMRGYAPANRFAPYTFSQFASDCLGIADVLGVRQFDVAGAGIGGALAWTLAGYHPERVRSVTSVLFPHPAAVAYACEHEPQSRRQWQARQQRLGAADPRRQAADLLAADAAGLKELLEAGHLPASYLKRYVARMRAPGALAAALSWHSAVSLEEFAWVPAVQVPALLLWSEAPDLSRLAAEASKECVDSWFMEVEQPRGAQFLLETSPAAVTRPLLAWLRALDEPRRTEA